jgi:hypothetical protein
MTGNTDLRDQGTAALILFVMLVLVALPLRAQEVISHSVFGNGGVTTSNAAYTVRSTVGQNLAGTARDAALTVSVGFWHVTGATVVPTSIRDNESAEHLPWTFKLHQNYPNPFNPSTSVRYDIPVAGHVRLDVFNMLGQHVTTLVDAAQQAGHHVVSFDAGDLASGAYIYTIQVGGYRHTRRMVLIK